MGASDWASLGSGQIRNLNTESNRLNIGITGSMKMLKKQSHTLVLAYNIRVIRGNIDKAVPRGTR